MTRVDPAAYRRDRWIAQARLSDAFNASTYDRRLAAAGLRPSTPAERELVDEERRRYEREQLPDDSDVWQSWPIYAAAR